ncbi:hypothetical protein EDC27_2309 [Desulfosoma caldarium]|uniref:Uncharacterized protein n=1 Tax=Desulfosoma caldarium TaxID=610254 RepID=A0A3N1UIE6_9BACT|nr:hypothetical protein EDC27_2309 [Desulfosoma caldarium]
MGQNLTTQWTRIGQPFVAAAYTAKRCKALSWTSCRLEHESLPDIDLKAWNVHNAVAEPLEVLFRTKGSFFALLVTSTLP